MSDAQSRWVRSPWHSPLARGRNETREMADHLPLVSDRHPGIPGWGLYDRPLLCCCRHGHRVYPNDLSAACILFEGHVTVAKRKERMIGAHADVAAGMNFGSALTHEDVARDDGL